MSEYAKSQDPRLEGPIQRSRNHEHERHWADREVSSQKREHYDDREIAGKKVIATAAEL